jgi:predicted nucleic acid-binding protein
VKRRAITERAGERAVEQLSRLPIRASGSSALMCEVWLLRGELTPYDACYVALARRLRAPFMTADGRLARTLSKRRDRVLHLSDVS